jgi:putative PD-(D/E)XK family protein DUF4420
MTALPFVQEAWDALQGTGRVIRGELRVFVSDVQMPAGPVLFAVDSEGLRHLLIPVVAGHHSTEDRDSAGVQVRSRQLEDAGRLEEFVDVVCQKPHLNELFSILLTEMMQGLARDPDHPAVLCVQVLNRWRELLQREPPGVLGQEALSGLFGELWHMRELARLEPASLAIWLGPKGGRHDFLRGVMALEVKSTSSRLDRPRVFEIHGVDQLRPPPGGTLHVAAMRLERAHDAGESVPDVLDEIAALGADRLELTRRTALLGFDVRDADIYRTIRFHVLEDRMYSVDAGFPRLTASSFVGGALPPGVVNLRYQIDLTGEPPHPMNQKAVRRLYEALARGPQS